MYITKDLYSVLNPLIGSDPPGEVIRRASGISFNMLVASYVVVLIFLFLQILSRYFLFKKAGRPGWHCIVPVLSTYTEFDICWNGFLGIIAGVGSLVVNIIGTSQNKAVAIFAAIVLSMYLAEKWMLAKSFGKGVLFAIGLIFFPHLFMLILGLGKAEYVG